MKNKQAILELPQQQDVFLKIISDTKHQVRHIAFSSVVVKDEVKHYVLVVWHDEEYGDHTY